MMKSKKSKRNLIIVIITVIIIIIGIIYILNNKDNNTPPKNDFQDKTGDIVIDVPDYKITYVDGLSITNDKLKEVCMKKVKVETKANKHVYLYLNKKKLDKIYNSEDVKWEVHNNGKVINSGSFKDFNNDSLTLLDNYELSDKESTYEIYLWIEEDSKIDNSKDLQLEVHAKVE